MHSLSLTVLSSALVSISVALAQTTWENPGPYYLPTGVHVTSTKVTMKVPAAPSGWTSDMTLFIWPGIQPGNGEFEEDPQNIGNGVLQPVLTFGSSCAPGDQPPFGTWWISGQYVNTDTQNGNFSGCFGGRVMTLVPGELVTCTMTLLDTTSVTWGQVCTRSTDGSFVEFDFTLDGQKQNWAELVIEPASDAVTQAWNFLIFFYDWKFTADAPIPTANCLVSASGTNFITHNPSLSSDGLTCTLGAVGFWNTVNDSPPITSIPSENSARLRARRS